MCHCMLMSCPTCNGCQMDNINHTIYLVSWTIISHAYNFQLNIHNNVNTLTHNIYQYFVTQLTTNQIMLLQNQVITTLTLEAKCGIYNACKKIAHTTAPNRPLILATEPATQVLNCSRFFCFNPNNPKTPLNHSKGYR